MKKYLRKILLFTSPFLIVFLFIAVIDPYEFVNVVHVIDSNTKIRVLQRSDASSPRGNLLWKSLHFKRKPCKNVIIGDSQGARFDEKLIGDLSGVEYFNFCVPGASYETIFSIFDFVTAHEKDLETVYLTVSFMNFNLSRSYDIFHYGKDYLDRPYLYFMSKDILADSWVNFMYATTGNRKLVEKSYAYMDPAIVDSKMAATMDLFFGDYHYPETYCDKLKEIVNFCDDHGIAVHFIILPTYKAVPEYLDDHGLTADEQRFEDFIKSLGPTYDFNYDNQYRLNRSCFVDYFHLRKEYVNEISEKIWIR